MGHAKLSRDGTYSKPGHDKLAYTTLLSTRVDIIRVCAYQLAQAVVIASRFSVVREQGVGVSADTAQELPIINYQSQKYRLLTAMAQAYALLFASQACTRAYTTLQEDQRQGSHGSLPRLHALTAGLKAYNTQVALDGAEDARKCCGGFGYSDMSGLPAILSTVVPLPTLEGENYVMYQQTARHLMKGALAVKKNKPLGEDVAYLRSSLHAQCGFRGADAFLSGENQLAIFRRRAARLVFNASSLLERSQTEDGLPYAEAWNRNMMPLVRAARAHIELFVLERFTSAVDAWTDSDAAKAVLIRLRDLFALTAIENPAMLGAMGFVEDGYMNTEQLEVVRGVVHNLVAQLVPDMIALGDAWDFTDASLGSAIGMYDGNVYERLMAWTRQLPLNERSRKDNTLHRRGYEGVIRQMLRSRI